MTNIVKSLKSNADWMVSCALGNIPDDATILYEAADLIESLRSRAEKAEAENARLGELIRDNGTPRFNAVCARAEKAEATCEKLAKALEDSSELINRLMHVHVAPDECTSFVKPSSQWFWDNGGTLACIAEQTANNRQALSEYRKEASE